jgi:hypothetical protein
MNMEFEHAGLKVKISQDEDIRSPREEQDNLATMALFHKRYCLGDKDHGYDSSDYSSWDEMEAVIIKKEKTADILPVYLYDHSGLAISVDRTGCFADRWDSGQIGFIYISKAKARKNFLEQVRKALLAEVATYDQYLHGDVWYYVVKDANGEVLDSCGGYYGQETCIADAKTAAEYRANKLAEEVQWRDANGQMLFAFAKG